MNDRSATDPEFPANAGAAPPAAPLRVLHFRRLFSVPSESFIYDPIVEMQRQGVDCSVLSIARMNTNGRPFPAQYLLPAPPMLQRERLLGRALSSRFNLSELDAYVWPLVRGALRRRVERIAPEVIHAHFGPDGCLIAPVAQELGIPLVVTFYGYDVSRLIAQAGDRWRRKYRELFRSASLLVGISQHVVDRLLELGADEPKTRVLHLGTRIDRFTYRDPAADFDGRTVRCVHVGRLTAKKSPVNLVRAFAAAQQQMGERVQLTLDIVGDGALAGACRRAIDRLNVADRVTMHGALPHDGVADVLHRAHLYTQHCVTAPDGDMEGLGVSFIEASACGLPVIATRHNGIPEVVRHGETGLLSPEGDIDAMAANLATLAADPSRWTMMGRAGREHVQANFALDRTVAETIDALTAAARGDLPTAADGAASVPALAATGERR